MEMRIGYRQADVVVAGGGTGGTVAAIAAARNGADVLLIERNAFPGGMFTGGNMIQTPIRPWAGIGKEIFDRLFDMGAAMMHPDDPPNYPLFHMRANAKLAVPYDPEMAKIVLFQMCEEAGVRLLLHSYILDAIVEGDTLRGIVIANKSGRQMVRAQIVCDGTGDGDVAAAAGAPFVKGYGPELQNKMMSMTLLVRLSQVDWPRVSEYSKTDPEWARAIATAMQNGELPHYRPRTADMIPYWGQQRPELSHLWYEDGALLWGGFIEDVDGTDAESLSRAEVECRKQYMADLRFLRKYIPGFEKARVENSGNTIGVRETRHIVGEYTYTAEDVAEKREFPDTVAYAVPSGLEVPYRCLVPKKVENLLLGCKCISAQAGQRWSGPAKGAYNHMKTMTSVMTYGQAAGTAAALCVKKSASPRNLDVKALQRTLMGQGALVTRDVLSQIRKQVTHDPGDLHSYSDETAKSARKA